MNVVEDGRRPEQARPEFRVGPWRVIPQRHELEMDGEIKRIQPRLMALLQCLASRPGQTFSRDHLLDRVWSRRVLNDEVLSRSIADLRAALDDNPREPRFIETIPKLGYRLIAPVQTQLDSDPQTATEPPVVAAIAPEPIPAAAPVAVATIATKSDHRRWRSFAGVLLLVLAVAWWLLPARPRERQGVDPAWLLSAQPLTSAPGWELRPRFSHSGQWLVYSASQPGTPGLHLWLRSRDGQIERQFTTGADQDLCGLFSADDQTLYWTRHSKDDCQLLRQPLLADRPQRLGSCASLSSCPDLSADGQELIYSAPPASDEHGAGLHALRLADGAIRVLTKPTQAQGDDRDPRIGPDGDIAFFRGTTGEASLWLHSASGDKRLAFDRMLAYGLVWLNPRQLLLASDVSGFRSLSRIDLDTGSNELLGARGARYPDLAADGSLVYELASYDANLWLYGSDAPPRRLTQSSRYDAYPRWSPDGRTLVLQSNRDGNEMIYLLDLASGREQRLPLAPDSRWAHPAWSADGSLLWLTRYHAGQTQIWTYSLGAETARHRSEFADGSHDAVPQPDADVLWYLTGIEQDNQLWRRQGSAAPELFASGIAQYLPHREGLFLLPLGTSVIQRCSLEQPRSCTSLAARIDPAHSLNWTVVGKGLWFVAPQTTQLQRLDLDSGQIRGSAWPRPGALSRAFELSADEQQLVIATLDDLALDLYWVQGQRSQ